MNQQTELVKYTSVPLVPGILNTTLDSHALAPNQAQAKLNCRTYRGIWECDLRYRRFLNPGNESPVGLTVWERGINGSMLFYVRKLTSDGKYYVVAQNASDAASSATTGTTVHSSVNVDGTSDCVMWQNGDRLHLIDGAGVLWYIEPATNGKYHISPQYRDYEPNVSDGIAITARPPYDGAVVAINLAADTMTDDAASLVHVTPGAWTASNNVMKSTGCAFTHSGDPGWWNAELVFAVVKDWSDVETVYIPYTSGSSGKKSRLEGQANHTIIEIEDNAGNKARIGYTKSAAIQLGTGPYVNHVTYSLKDASLTGINMAQIKKIRFYWVWSVYSESGIDFYVGPVTLGGKYMNRRVTTDRIFDAAPYKDDIKYAYRYRKNATNPGTDPTNSTDTLGWFESTVLGDRVLGDNTENNMKRGAWVKVAPPTNDPDTFPFATYDKIDIVRRIYDTVAAAWRWIRIAIVDNNSLAAYTPSKLDKLDHIEVYALKTAQTDYGVNDKPTGGSDYNPNTSGQVKNMNCGCFWKGVNVICSKDGKVHFSKSGDFRTVLWDSVNVGPLDPTFYGNPRTVDLGVSTATPPLACVGHDTLYIGCRGSVFCFVGSIPSFSEGPFNMQNVRGIVGKKAMVAYQEGALAAADDGLWFIAVPPSFQGEASDVINQELTKDIRDTYQWLLTASDDTTDCRSEVIVVHDRGHIWLFNRSKYLHRSQDGEWSYGIWADSRRFKHAVSHVQYGLITTVVDSDDHSNFSLGVIGDWQKDGGLNGTGSNGTAVSWSYRTGVSTEDLSVKGIRVTTNQAAAPAVNVVVKHSLGADRTFTFTNATPHKRATSPTGGRYVDFTVNGGGADKVYSVKVQTTGRSDRRSNLG